MTADRDLVTDVSVYVDYVRENGCQASVPGALDYWRSHLTDPKHSTEGPTNQRNPVVRLRERTRTETTTDWESPS